MGRSKTEESEGPRVVWGLRKIGVVVGLSESVMLAVAEGRHPHAAWLRSAVRYTDGGDGRRRWYAVISELEAAARANPRATELTGS